MEKGRETSTCEQNINRLPLICTWTRAQNCSPGMCPNRGSNWQSFTLQDDAQPTWPHHSGQNLSYFQQFNYVIAVGRKPVGDGVTFFYNSFIQISFTYHKFTPLKCGFLVYSKVVVQLSPLILEHFHLPKRSLTPTRIHCPFPLPSALAVTNLLCLHGFAYSGHFT